MSFISTAYILVFDFLVSQNNAVAGVFFEMLWLPVIISFLLAPVLAIYQSMAHKRYILLLIPLIHIGIFILHYYVSMVEFSR